MLGKTEACLPCAYAMGQTHFVEHTTFSESEPILQACLSIADAPSLGELESRTNQWLDVIFGPCAWALAFAPQAEDVPRVMMEHRSRWEYATFAYTEPLIVDHRERGTLRLELVQPIAETSLKHLSDVGRALSFALNSILFRLNALANTIELCFVRSLIYQENSQGQGIDPDRMAESLLVQLGVSSLQIVIDSMGQGDVAWGVSSRRINLHLPPEQRMRLHDLITDVAAPLWAQHQESFLVHDTQLRELSQQYELPYLRQLGSLTIVPIQSDGKIFGAIVVGEERQWARQPISDQTLQICVHLARSIAGSVARSQGIGRRIDHGRFTQLLVGSLDDAIVTTEDDVITSWNAAATTLFGYADEEVRGKTLAECLPFLLEAEGARLSTVHQNRSLVELAMPVTGGREVIIHWKQILLRGLSIHTPVVINVFREVGQERELEQLKDELLSMVSHELRTPLNGINGFGRLLLERPHMPESMRREALEMFQSSVDRLSRLAEDFIDLARARRHHLPLKVEDVAIGDVIVAAVRELRRRHTDHTIRLHVEKDLPIIRADSLRVKQILDNLVSNAAKYAPLGTTISIRVRCRDDMVVVSVADQGPGIARDIHDHIFKPFYRAVKARHTHVSGVGLGLSIVKTLVDSHGGTVSLRSSPGHGATFTFTLRVQASDDEDDARLVE